MLLRRITQHIKDQNWFAVFVDFVIVVIGVFIGIQVANWNAARVEAEREQEVLANILRDIRNDRVELASGLSTAMLNVDAVNHALAKAGLKSIQSITMPVDNIEALTSFEFSIAPAREFTPDQLRRLWSISTVRLHPIRSDSAFSALVAAGDLSLIQDEALVFELQRYKQRWMSLMNSQDTTYRPFRNRAIYVGQECGLSPFSEIDEDEYIQLLRTCPTLSNALRTLAEFAVLHQSQIQRVDEMAAALAERLERISH